MQTKDHEPQPTIATKKQQPTKQASMHTNKQKSKHTISLPNIQRPTHFTAKLPARAANGPRVPGTYAQGCGGRPWISTVCCLLVRLFVCLCVCLLRLFVCLVVFLFGWLIGWLVRGCEVCLFICLCWHIFSCQEGVSTRHPLVKRVDGLLLS